jgi:hypothetical protein
MKKQKGKRMGIHGRPLTRKEKRNLRLGKEEPKNLLQPKEPLKITPENCPPMIIEAIAMKQFSKIYHLIYTKQITF